MVERINETRLVKWFERWSPVLFPPLVVGVVVAIVLGSFSIVTTNRKSDQNVERIEMLVADQQKTFCGFATAVANTRPGDANPTTETGKKIVDQQQAVVVEAKVMRSRLECDKKR